MRPRTRFLSPPARCSLCAFCITIVAHTLSIPCNFSPSQSEDHHLGVLFALNHSIRAMAHADWNHLSRFFFRSGLLDHGTLPTSVVDTLSKEESETQYSTAANSVAYLSEYLSEIRTIGEPSYSKPTKIFEIPSTAAYIVLIRGSPRLSFLRELGQELQISPALLLHHLNIPGSFRISAFPDPTWPAFTARMISVGTYGSTSLGLFSHTIGERQYKIDDYCRRYCTDLLTRNDIGFSQCRKVNLHGTHFFSVEQEITLIVHRQTQQGWSGILLNDCGVDARSSAPWLGRGPGHSNVKFFPLAGHGHCALDTIIFPGPVQDNREKRDFSKLDPYLSRAENEFHLLDAEEKRLALEDPYVCVCDILRTFILTWRRFFSFIRSLHEAGNIEDERFECLRNDGEVIQRSRYFIDGALVFLDAKPTMRLPTANIAKDRDMIEEIVGNIKRDLLLLRKESESVSEYLAMLVRSEVNAITRKEANRTHMQGERLKWVTLLAYLFLPLSLVAACFGMNLDVLDNPKPPLKYFFIAAVPFTIVCCILPQTEILQRFIRFLVRT
jgi:hypothetical protein